MRQIQYVLLVIMRNGLTEEERRNLRELGEMAKHPKVRKALKEFIRKTTS